MTFEQPCAAPARGAGAGQHSPMHRPGRAVLLYQDMSGAACPMRAGPPRPRAAVLPGNRPTLGRREAPAGCPTCISGAVPHKTCTKQETGPILPKRGKPARLFAFLWMHSGKRSVPPRRRGRAALVRPLRSWWRSCPLCRRHCGPPRRARFWPWWWCGWCRPRHRRGRTRGRWRFYS